MAALAVVNANSERSGLPISWALGIWLSVALMGLFFVREGVRRAAIRLTATAVDVYGSFRTTTVDRRAINGYRVTNIQGIDVLEIYHTDFATQEEVKTKISILFKKDEVFDAWFEKIPNLNEMEIAASNAELESDERLGPTREVRLRNITKARWVARVLTAITFSTLAWAWLYPRPYMAMFLIVAALPWLAIALCARWDSAFSIDDIGLKTARADLTRILIMPGFVLGLRAINDAALLEPWSLVIPSAFLLAAMLGIVVWIAPVYREKHLKTLTLAALLVAYSASTIAIANFLFDRKTPSEQLVTVVNKRYTTGKSAANYLLLAAWGPRLDEHEVKVTGEFYHSINVGETVCMRHHAGAARLAWYAVSNRRDCKSQYRAGPVLEKA